jgi:hypothetical protein
MANSPDTTGIMTAIVDAGYQVSDPGIEEIESAICWLLSDAASFVTGHILSMTGLSGKVIVVGLHWPIYVRIAGDED